MVTTQTLLPQLLLLLLLLSHASTRTASQQVANGGNFGCFITDLPSWRYSYPTPLTPTDLLSSIECGTSSGASVRALTPKVVGPFASVVGGMLHACGLLRNGTALCWGDNTYQQTTLPAALRGVKILQVSAGAFHTCYLTEARRMVCAGTSTSGEINIPAQILFTQIAAGTSSSCGIQSNGPISCYGKLSLNAPDYDPNDPFIQIQANINANAFVCALRQSGNVTCGGSTGDIADLRTMLPSGCASSISAAFTETATPCIVACKTGVVLCLSPTGGSWDRTTSFSDSIVTQLSGMNAISADRSVLGSYLSPVKGSVLQVDYGAILFTDGQIRDTYATQSPMNVTRFSATPLRAGWCAIISSGLFCSPRAGLGSVAGNLTSVSVISTRLSQYTAVVTNSTGSARVIGFNSTYLNAATARFSPPPLQYAVCSHDGCCGWASSDSSIVCWGNYGQGNWSIPLPTRPFGFTAFRSIVASSSTNGFQICGIRASNFSAICAVIDPSDSALTPFVIDPSLQFSSVSISAFGFCGLFLSNQTVLCVPNSATLISYPLGSFEKIVVLDFIACGIRSDNSMECGMNSYFSLPSFARPFASSLAGTYAYQDLNNTLTCPLGTMGNGVGYITPLCGGLCTAADNVTSCLLGCPEGYVCSARGVQPCPAGSYCGKDTYILAPLCPAGRYGQTVGLTSANCTGACPSGYLCQAGTVDYKNSPCPLGLYCPKTSTLTPLPCDAGYVGSSVGNSDSHCNGPCPPGYLCARGTSTLSNSLCPISNYCPLNATLSAFICPKGHYCDAGSFSPAECPPGTYGLSDGLSSPSCSGMCPAGYLCKSASVTYFDSPCPAGWSCKADGTTDLTKQKCQAGYWCQAGSTSSMQAPCGSRSVYCPAGSVNPIPITSGWYGVASTANATGGDNYLTQFNQSLCETGHFCDGSGLMKPCVAGQYSSTMGAATCVSCTVGEFAGAGATSCETCEAGKYSSYPDQPCSVCSSGSYSSAQAATCIPCDLGTASGEMGRNSSCADCVAGTYASSRGMTVCLTCAPPSYTPTSSQCQTCANVVSSDGRSCVSSDCAANTELNSLTRICEPCPISKSSVRGGRCITCPQGYYTPAVGSGCIECGDSGLDCTTGNGYVLLKQGYWAYRVIDENGVLVYRTAACPDDFCQGGPLQQLAISSANSSSGTDSGTTSSDGAAAAALQEILQASQCAFPRDQSIDNYLCGRCAVGYELWNSRCVECSHNNGGLIFLTFLLSIALILFFIRSAALAASTQAQSSTNAALSVIIVYFVQTAAIEIGSVSKYLTWFQLSNFGLQSTSSSSTCIAPLTSQQQLIFAMILPFVFTVEVLIAALFHFVIYKSGACVNPPHESEDHSISAGIRRFFGHFSMSLYIGAIISALLFSYTGVASASLAFFSCTQAGDTKVIFLYPNIRCDSAEYHQGFALALSILVVYVLGFPLGTIAFLWKRWSSVQAAHKAKHHTETRQLQEASGESRKSTSATTSPETLEFLERFGLLFSVYHESAWWWQCVILLRRGLFVAVAAALANHAAYRFLIFLYLNLASLALQLHLRPFQTNWLNQVEVASNSLLIIISALLQTPTPFSVGVQILLLLLLIVPLAGLLIAVGKQNWSHVRTVINTQLEKRRTKSESAHHAKPVSAEQHSFHAQASGTTNISPLSTSMPELRTSSAVASSDVELVVVGAATDPDSLATSSHQTMMSVEMVRSDEVQL